MAREYTGIIRRGAMSVKAGEAAAASAATRQQLGLKSEVMLDAVEEDSPEEDEDAEEENASE